jgi:hypothetical protein
VVVVEKEVKRERSKSRLRQAAAGVLGAGAAAIGLKKYNDAKKEREKSTERGGSHDRRDSEERKGDRKRDRRSRDRERRRTLSCVPVCEFKRCFANNKDRI